MAILEREVYVEAPPELTFETVADTESLPNIWPSLLMVKNLQRLSNGGARFEYDYLMAGVRIGGHSEDLEYIPNERIVSNIKSGIRSMITWCFKEDSNGGTWVTFQAEYEIPIPVIGSMAEEVVIGINEMDIGVMLTNLKRTVENKLVREVGIETRNLISL